MFLPRVQAFNPHAAAALTEPRIPLPPRALDVSRAGRAPVRIEHPGAAPLGAYEFRFEYVCRAAKGCGGRKITLRWATFAGDEDPRRALPPYTRIPSTALLPAQSASEATRRALYSKLQQGWGTWWNPSMLAWTLLPEGFTLKAGLFRKSNGAWLSPQSLTVNAFKLHTYAIRAGLHSYDQSHALGAGRTERQNTPNNNTTTTEFVRVFPCVVGRPGCPRAPVFGLASTSHLHLFLHTA